MKKSVRASAPESQRSQWLERLTDAVNRLADEVRVVRDVLDETREDLGWLTRNGIPGRHGEHRQIVRMARDPLASNANELLEVITSTVASANSSGLAPDVFDELIIMAIILFNCIRFSYETHRIHIILFFKSSKHCVVNLF